MANEGELRVGPESDPDRYRLLHRIGGGGEGEVWLGTRELTDGSITVAVKSHNADRLGGGETIAEAMARLETQTARLRPLRVPGLAAVHEAFLGTGPHEATASSGAPTAAYLVMEYVEGDPLTEWAARELRPSRRLGVLNDAAAALDTLHQMGQVHGDVKPSNLLVKTFKLPNGGESATSVLVDFGVMRAFTRSSPSKVVGTNGFIAPELAHGGLYTPQSDLYAFATVAALLVCGNKAGDDIHGAALAAGLSPAGATTLLQGLDPDPQERAAQLTHGIAGWLSRIQGDLSTTIPSIGEPPGQTATQQYAEALPDSVLSPRSPASGSQAPRRSMSRVLMPFALIALVLAAAGLLVLQPWRTDTPDISAANPDELDTAAQEQSTTTQAATEPTTVPASSEASTTLPTSTTVPPTTTATSAATTAPVEESTTQTTLPTTAQPSFVNLQGVEETADGNSGGFSQISFEDAYLINTQSYDQSLVVTVRKNPYSSLNQRWVEFHLGKEFSRFTAVAGYGDNSATDGTLRLELLNENGTTLFSNTYSLGESESIDVDVSDVFRLRVEATLVGDATRANRYLGLGNAQLQRS